MELKAGCVFSFSFTCISDQASGPGERLALVPGGPRKCSCLVWKIRGHTYGVGFLCAWQKQWIKLCFIGQLFFLLWSLLMCLSSKMCPHIRTVLSKITWRSITILYNKSILWCDGARSDWDLTLSSDTLLPPIHILLWTQWLIYFMLQINAFFFFCLTAVFYHHDSPGDKLYYVWFIFSWLIPMPENSFDGFHGKGTTHKMVWDFIHFLVQENIVFLNCHTKYITFIRCKRPQHQMWNVSYQQSLSMAVMNKEELILNSCF